MDRSIEQEVRRRAGNRCEYCLLPQAASPLVFPIDHVIARQHNGPSTLENLALACGYCNAHKGPNIAGIDPETGHVTPLFHPRRDNWAVHFRFAGAIALGLTAVGRTTIIVLAMNHPHQKAIRQALIEEGVMRPDALE